MAFIQNDGTVTSGRPSSSIFQTMKSILNGIISFFNLFLSSITGNPNTIRVTNTNNNSNSRGGNGNRLSHKGLGGGGKKKNKGRNIRGMKNLGTPDCGPKGGGG